MKMTIGTELEKLHHLREKGVLSESEFLTAKSKLLNTLGPENSTGSGVSQIGKAANSWVKLQWTTSGVGFVLAILAIIFIFIPFGIDMLKRQKEFDASFQATKQQIEQANQEMNSRRKKFDEDFEKQSKDMDSFRKKNFSN